MARYPHPTFKRRSFLAGMGAVAAGVTLLPRGGIAAEEKKLNVYNWDTYIGDTTIATFEQASGIQVQYDLYANNEELFAKLKEGNPGYDLIFPSDYMVETMISLDMLEPLDHSMVPNLKNVDPDPNFTNPKFNPGLKFGVPYFWGTIGIGYRKSKIGDPPKSWKAIFDNPEMAGRIAVLADQRAVIGLALKYLGFPMNSVDPAEIGKAQELLIKAKKSFKAFAPDSGQDMLIAGDVDLVMEWNGDILKVMEEDDDLNYAVPDEGTMVWMDNVCIPKGAPHPENAHAFLNHLHDPEVNAEIANTIHYATANKAAKAYIGEADLVNPAIYPTEEVIAKSEALIDVGEHARLYDEAWTAIQAA